MGAAAYVVGVGGALMLAATSRTGERSSRRARWRWFGIEIALILAVFGSLGWIHSSGTDVAVPFVLFVVLDAALSRRPRSAQEVS
jgi:hypothetical protein